MLLRIDSLNVSAEAAAGPVPLVRDVSLLVDQGEFVGLVGESGCGKSLTLRALLGLLDDPPYRVTGDLRLDGEDLLGKSSSEMRQVRGRRIAMVPQDPMGSLDPLYSVRSQINEVLKVHDIPARGDGKDRAVEMLRAVRVADPERRVRQYPYQFSGGMRQRVMVAMALACSPDVLVADEPTTALDATTQAVVLRIMRDALAERGMALIMVTHDLAIISELVDRVYVMYAGEIVEEGPTAEVFQDPRHPYTRGLLSSIPTITEAPEGLSPIEGSPPDLASAPEGCAFAPRCWLRTKACTEASIPLSSLRSSGLRHGDGRRARCLATQAGGWHAETTLPPPQELTTTDPGPEEDETT